MVIFWYISIYFDVFLVYFDIFLYILMYFGSPGVPRNRELRVTGPPGSRTGSGLLSIAQPGVSQRSLGVLGSAVADSPLCGALDPPRQALCLRMAYRVPYSNHLPYLMSLRYLFLIYSECHEFPEFPGLCASATGAGSSASNSSKLPRRLQISRRRFQDHPEWDPVASKTSQSRLNNPSI